jgi:hypothetical protein
MPYILLAIILSLFPLKGVASLKYELSICAIFQNEAKYLPEWIEYHRLVGVQHFYLYNNNSQDNYKEVLDPYIKKKIVELIDWPSPELEDWTPYQKGAYNHCINKNKERTRWLALIDIDEFIVPVKVDNLQTLLKNYAGAGGLQIFWQFFGTSGISKISDNQTLIESLIMKAPKDFKANYNFKTIVQPKVVSNYKVHGGDYHEPWYGIFPHKKRGGANQPIHIDIVRIHHYWTRDEDYFLNQKIPRRERYEKAPYTAERIEQIYADFNQVEDKTILKFVPALRKRLGK